MAVDHLRHAATLLLPLAEVRQHQLEEVARVSRAGRSTSGNVLRFVRLLGPSYGGISLTFTGASTVPHYRQAWPFHLLLTRPAVVV